MDIGLYGICVLVHTLSLLANSCFMDVVCPQAVDKWKLEVADPAISRSGTGAGETMRLAVSGIPFTRATKARVSKRGITGTQDIDGTEGSTDLGTANKWMRIHAAQSLDNAGIGRAGAVFQPGAASGSLLMQTQEPDANMEMATSKDLNLKVRAVHNQVMPAAPSDPLCQALLPALTSSRTHITHVDIVSTPCKHCVDLMKTSCRPRVDLV